MRTVRSFVLRQGRITQSQQNALDEYWPRFGLEADTDFDGINAFGRTAPVVLEIGFGNGECIAQLAANNPDRDYLGIEVHRPGVGHLLLKMRELGLSNIRIYCADAVDILKDRIPDESLVRIQIYFPDPWHKKRHNKRRLINEEFVSLATRKLKPGGIIHCATDWEDYAQQMLEVLGSNGSLRNQAASGLFSERPDYRPLTKFESRGQRLGHGVWDLLFEKIV